MQSVAPRLTYRDRAVRSVTIGLHLAVHVWAVKRNPVRLSANNANLVYHYFPTESLSKKLGKIATRNDGHVLPTVFRELYR